MANALQQLDTLITNVETTTAVTSVSTPAATCSDVAWRPFVPAGHTAFSWYGSSDVQPPPEGAVETKAAAPQKVVEKKVVEQKAPKQKKPKQPKQKRPKAPPKPVVPDFYKLQIVVGKIVECEPHPNADKLYLEKIDIGEAEPRQILSGLRLKIPLDQMVGTDCLVIANLKPSSMVGIKSYGMVLCASEGEEKKEVVFVNPPEGATPGQRVYLEGEEDNAQLPHDEVVNARKKNHAWMKCFPSFVTDAEGYSCYGDKRMVTAAGLCKPTRLPNGLVR